MEKQFILILGASTDQLFMIRTAQELGYGTVSVDANPKAPGLAAADYSAPIDFSHINEVIEFATSLLEKGINLGGVTTMGSDVPHIIARIAQHFGWPGLTIESGDLTTNKYAMKQCLEEHGIPVPPYALVHSGLDVRNQWKTWGCDQIIIKPTDRAGSRGVQLLTNLSESDQAYEYAFSSGISGDVVVEEYIPGPQISTESILHNGKAMTPGFADRVYEQMEVFHPQIMENGGWVPTRHSAEIQKATCKLVEDAARALGIISGPAKGDVVLDPDRGLMVIEIAARLSGGDFCESLVPLGIGVNYVRDVIRIAMGEEPIWDEMLPKMNNAVANRYFFLPPGKLLSTRGTEAFEHRTDIVKFELSYKLGDTIPVIANHGQRVGVFIVVGRDHQQVQAIVDEVYDTVQFNIEGKWMSGKASSVRP